MIRKLLLSVLCIGTALSLGCSEVYNNYEEENNSPQIILRLANNQDSDYPTSLACDYFAERVLEESDGKIKIICFHESELGDENSVIEQLKFGGIDFARVSSAALCSMNEELNVLSLPYLYESDLHMWNVLNSDLGENFLKSFEENSIIGLNWYTGGKRNFYSSSNLDGGLESLENLDIRIQDFDIMSKTMELLKINPVPMNFEKVYPSLLTKGIDGAENDILSYMSMRHCEVAKYILLDEHSTIPEMLIASKSTMGTLTKQQQEIIKRCARESTAKQIELWQDAEQVAISKAIANGCVVITPTDEEKQELIEAVEPLKKEYSEKYGDIIKQIENTPH